MTVTILRGDCRDVLRTLEPESVNCVVTSPPYWGLRDYGVDGQIGLEETHTDYTDKIVSVFDSVRRVLRKDGTVWLNLGDSYAGLKGFRPEHAATSTLGGGKNHIGLGRGAPLGDLKQKDLVGIPWRVAFALQADGWYLRQDIIWSKPNPMPESVRDRCTKAHEYIFLLSKSERYFYDASAIAEATAYPVPEDRHPSGDYSEASGRNDGGMHRSGGFATGEKRNRRSVWEVTTQPFSEAHFATFPPALIEPCILAGCPMTGTVLDPFGGAGTTGLVADRLGRHAILIELNPEYAAMAERRISNDAGMFADVAYGR